MQTPAAQDKINQKKEEQLALKGIAVFLLGIAAGAVGGYKFREHAVSAVEEEKWIEKTQYKNKAQEPEAAGDGGTHGSEHILKLYRAKMRAQEEKEALERQLYYENLWRNYAAD
jgi:hypothetical protein